MPDVRKEIARPGTYTYLNPAGQPERLTVTSATIKHYYDQGKAMLADGLSIPVPKEHQEDAKPQTASQRAAKHLENNAGFVRDYEIKDDRLYSILDIPDAEFAKKLPTTIRSVSPWINSFTDGNGKKWEGVISHVALTTRPRITKQANFETISLAMDAVNAAKEKVFDPKHVPSGGIVLSERSGLLKKKGDKFKPKHPIAFSLMAGVRLSLDDMNIDDDDDLDGDDTSDADDADGKKNKKKDSGPPVDQFSNKDQSTSKDAESPGDVSFEELIPHLLEMLGVKVSAGSKDEEFLKMLVRDLLREVKALGKEAEQEDLSVLGDVNNPAGGKKPPGQVVQESPPMSGYMSLTAEQVASIADPKEKQFAEAYLSLRQESERSKSIADAATKNILGAANATRQARIDRLLKKLPVRLRDKIVAEVASPSAQLSLDANGSVKDPLATLLEVYEALSNDPREIVVNGIRLSEQPQPTGDILSDADAEKLANQQMRVPAPAA